MPTHWSDWLFWIGGWALAGAGALLLLWAIRGDRSRGRRRCRKCWYDMGSIEAVDGVWTCPECGKQAAREKLLQRPRRRWRWAAACSVIFLVAYGLWTTPRIREEGWPGAVPTSLALLGMDLLIPDVPAQRVFVETSEVLKGKDFRSILYKSIFEHRLGTSDSPAWVEYLSLWQAGRAARGKSHVKWALCDRMLEALSWDDDEIEQRMEFLESLVHVRVLTRASWQEGQDVYARVRLVTPMIRGRAYGVKLTPLSEGLILRTGRYWRSPPSLGSRPAFMGPGVFGVDTVSLGRPLSSDMPMQYRVEVDRLTDDSPAEQTLIHESTLEIPTRVIRGEPAMPIPWPQNLQPLARPVGSLSFAQRSVGLYLAFSQRIPFDMGKVAFAGRGEIHGADGVVHEFAFWTAYYSAGNYGSSCRLMIEPAAPFELFDSKLTLRLTGDPLIAMRQLSATHYWDGVIEVPIN